MQQDALAQEKGQRARVVMSLRETIGGMKAAGDVEGRLKAELVRYHELLAASKSSQVRLPHPSAHPAFQT